MFTTAQAILNQFFDGVSRFNIYSIEAYRGENPEDVFYLCEVADRWYVAYETDYIGELSAVADEAADIFKMKPLRWMVKKDHYESFGKVVVPIQDAPGDGDASAREALIFSRGDSYLRYMLLAVE